MTSRAYEQAKAARLRVDAAKAEQAAKAQANAERRAEMQRLSKGRK